MQTRKNEEYRALTQAIEGCQEAIRQIEDRELDLMEQGEAAQREVDRLTREVAQTQAFVEDQLAGLNAREQSLKAEWDQLRQNREELAAAVEESARQRYERLIRSRGDTIVVGIQHGVCGGCHMRLPAQVIVSCRAGQELITCTNCGRILYYTHDMDMAVAD
ncbi:MAG: putative zinc ribbon domain protein [Verrucomicrobia bacterium ADurb.Bin118]|nr:MAG: putative zinc ribbon domain protein [Verrucomicrobia bacterium ADurb.Bin118]